MNVTGYRQVAVEFASALVAGDFTIAWVLLSPALREGLTPERLRTSLHGMYCGYANGDPTGIHYDEKCFAEDWPNRLPGDLGWAYISIEGEGFLEAVTLIVAEVDGELLIRSIEWGRP